MAVTGVNDYTGTYAATGSTGTKGSSGLSSTAKDYLNGLRQKYSDVNIMVADFTSNKKMESFMMGCSGSNNIIISSNIIEQMANDPAAAAKYEKVIADAPKAGEEIARANAEKGLETLACGTRIDKDGKVTYWAVAASTRENPAAGQREKLQKQLEEKRAKKKEEEAAKEKRLERAETLEKLLEKIRAGKAENEGKTKEDDKGTQVDFTV